MVFVPFTREWVHNLEPCNNLRDAVLAGDHFGEIEQAALGEQDAMGEFRTNQSQLLTDRSA